MIELVARAEAFARERHAGQTRKGAAREPYASHLEEVVAFVRRHGGDATTRAAAWLHDTVEDCPPTSQEEIERLFGAEVAGLVRELTDDKSLPDAERKEMQRVHAHDKSPRAALVKIADKTSNIAGVARSTPIGWSRARCLNYLRWGEDVVNALPPGHDAARAEFATTLASARAAISAGVAATER